MTRARREPGLLLHVAAVLTWLVVGAPLALACVRDTGLLGQSHVIVWWCGFLVFLPAVLLADRTRRGPARTRRRILVLVATTAALTCCFALPFPITGVPLPSILLVIVATGLVPAFPIAIAVVWVLGQSLLLAWSYHFAGVPPDLNVTITCSWIGFQLFAMFLAFILERERHTRADLARTLAELEGTRELLAERTRTAERVRIARELHDTLGHHLAALSLNLEAASHQDAEAARASVEKGKAITASMLQELRAVVSEMREEPIVDLARSVERLIEPIPVPHIHLSFADDFRVDDPEVAHALFRITQEVLTNTIKHAGAAHLWLEYGRAPDGLRLVARDDGRGADESLNGAGLRGIHERATAHGGRVQVAASDQGTGLRPEVVIPVREPPP